MSNPIATLLRDSALKTPTRVALALDGRETSWAELYASACRVANALIEIGVAPRERVSFIDKNGIEFFEFLFGCALCGAVPVPISWRFTPQEMRATIADAQIRLVVVGHEFTGLFDDQVKDTAGSPTVVAIGEHARSPRWASWIAARPNTDPHVATEDDAIVMQLYTSGTTGLPKGVLISDSNLTCLMQDLRGQWDVRADDISLVCMPLFHMGGVGWALAGMAAGCRSVLVREFAPAGVLDLLLTERVTVAFFVPAMLAFLCAVPGSAERTYELRRIIYSGSPIAQETLKVAMTTFKCEFVQIYGMSETSGSFAQLGPRDHDPDGPRAGLLRSAGRPYPWVQVRILEIQQQTDCAVGEVGEIWTLSAQNTRGYWNNDSETRLLLTSDGWLRTGDAGYRDEGGYLFLTDRIKDMIISGGENVYPAEVENALASHPAIAEVAVIGVPSEKWGETVKAVVAFKSGASAPDAEIIKFARDRLAAYKCPTSVNIVPALPRSPTGKVLKKDLREPYWKGKERRIN